MAQSYIKFTFTENLGYNAVVIFDVTSPSFVSGPHGGRFFQITRWKNNILTEGGEVNINSPMAPTSLAGESSAANFENYYNTYSQLVRDGFFAIHRVDNVVTIFSDEPTIFYENTVFNNYYPIPTHPSVIVEIVNYNDVVIPFSITSITYSQATTDPCSKIKATILLNELATTVLSPYYDNSNTSNPVIYDVVRGGSYGFAFENSAGVGTSQLVYTPKILNSANFSVQTNSGPGYSTVVITSTAGTTDGLTLEYSLDNITFQTSNVFNQITPGNYTLYVRDNFGCSFSKDFNVDEFNISSPYFYISKANSFRFANRIDWGDSENYKNDENTLSCEVDVPLPYAEIQQFQSADVITTQFKSNYSSNIASIIKEDQTIVSIPIIKKTNNIGIKDRMDGKQYNVGNGKTGIYFASGNTYDYGTNVVASPYSLNGLLPEWAQIGNYFDVNGFWFLIEDIIFDEIINSDVIVFSNNYTGPEINVVVGSIYNRFNYEVYEFSIDMVDYIDQKFRVKLENIDPNFTDITHISELIWCKIKHINTLEIRYKNTTNTDVMYSTGIEHKIRIPYLKISGKTDEQSEVNKTDTDAILLSADLYEVEDFKFEPVTKEIWRKLMIALSHEKVSIDGVGYVKNGSFNTEGPLDDSNLYVLTATMIKTGNVYNSQTSGNLDFNGSQVSVPGIISTQIGFVQY